MVMHQQQHRHWQQQYHPELRCSSRLFGFVSSAFMFSPGRGCFPSCFILRLLSLSSAIAFFPDACFSAFWAVFYVCFCLSYISSFVFCCTLRASAAASASASVCAPPSAAASGLDRPQHQHRSRSISISIGMGMHQQQHRHRQQQHHPQLRCSSSGKFFFPYGGVGRHIM